MRYRKSLLNKPPIELTDEELKVMGRHFLKHPLQEKPIRNLHKCLYCQHLIWWDNLGTVEWKCLEKDKIFNCKQITHARYCEDYKRDEIL